MYICYRFQSERITETAKRSNVVNYLDSMLSRPGVLKPNRDILASRRQRSGFRDRISQTGTVSEQPGRLVSLVKHNSLSTKRCIMQARLNYTKHRKHSWGSVNSHYSWWCHYRTSSLDDCDKQLQITCYGLYVRFWTELFSSSSAPVDWPLKHHLTTSNSIIQSINLC